MTADVTPHMPESHPPSGDFKGRDAVIGAHGRLFQETGGSFRADLRGAHVDGRGTPGARRGYAMALHHVTAERAGRRFKRVRRFPGDGCLVFRIVGDEITGIDECVEDIDQQDGFWA